MELLRESVVRLREASLGTLRTSSSLGTLFVTNFYSLLVRRLRLKYSAGARREKLREQTGHTGFGESVLDPSAATSTPFSYEVVSAPPHTAAGLNGGRPDGQVANWPSLADGMTAPRMSHCRRSNEAVSTAGKRGQGAKCGGVEDHAAKVNGVKGRSGWWAEWQGTRTLACTLVLTLVLPLVLGNVQQIAVRSRNGCNPSLPPAAFPCRHSHPVPRRKGKPGWSQPYD
ncbi:hypothetical protein PCL_12666 [Purpureocillium lilacinum]|uniref:Uncharacterized protein n=1 Tax=Purpureocillium lilacinum TaxID=33203 RepID=A0A2U3DPD2_PURLI|nr:hypothetical protein PCL_12666 [Purpureocillium lilacinum]